MTTFAPFFTLAASAPLEAPRIDPVLGLFLALFLVALNGFFVAAEFALVKVRRTQITPHAEQGSRRGKVADMMIHHLDAYLSATQLGITLASLALGWIGEPAFAWILEPLFEYLDVSEAAASSATVLVAFVIITVLHIVLGELAPKSLAIRKPEPTTLWIALPLWAFYKLTYPAIWALNHAANAILRLVGIEPISESELAQDEEEVRMMLSSDHSTRLSDSKRELLDNIFELSHRMARQIMVPRADVVYLSTERSLEENLAVARKSGHTRFPLCEDSLDRVVGMIHIKDLFRAPRPLATLEDVSREIAFVPETLHLDRLLNRMLAERVHLAAVLDEYGGVSGIVTLENVIEEIVGQIQDEFDSEKPELVEVGDGEYLVSGVMLVEEVEEELDIEFSERDEDTIGGVVLSELGRRPAVGDRVELPPLLLEVAEVQRNRIKALRVTLIDPQASGEPEETGEAANDGAALADGAATEPSEPTGSDDDGPA